MDPEIEAMLTFTATIWLLAVMVLGTIAVRKMYLFGRDGVDRPRRLAFKWLSDLASQFATGAAVFVLVFYFFLQIAESDGLIYSSLVFLAVALSVWFAPRLGRVRANERGNTEA